MTAPIGPVWAIVLAGGSGTRFGARKQFARVGGDRLVDLAVRAVTTACDHVVLVLPVGTPWDGAPVDAVVEAGVDRGASVRAGLAAVPTSAAIVVVHQAANPLASPTLIRQLIGRVADGADAAIPGLAVPDVVGRVVDGHLTQHLGRDDLVLIQTPGAFRAQVLRAAHASGARAFEDTALVAAIGGRVAVVPGDATNVHVTSPADLRRVAGLRDADGGGVGPLAAGVSGAASPFTT